MSYSWPIILVVISNILYQVCAKSVPKDMDAMASMTITYLVGALCSAVMYFIMNRNGNLLHEYSSNPVRNFRCRIGGWIHICL